LLDCSTEKKERKRYLALALAWFAWFICLIVTGGV
jgi:hypothetical protein